VIRSAACFLLSNDAKGDLFVSTTPILGTCRYRLPIGVNTNNDIVVTKVRDLLIREIKRENRGDPAAAELCANAVQITFPKQLGKRDVRFYTVDITANSLAHFQMIRATKFTVNRQVLDNLDTGCPQPANFGYGHHWSPPGSERRGQ
jgi:hypothetical protein